MAESTLIIVGLILIVSVAVALISGKLNPAFVFVVFPVVACLILGYSFDEIGGFVSTGISSVAGMVALFTFSIGYFGVMSDVGMFDYIVGKASSRLGNSVFVVLLMTCFVSAISHLDGSGPTTLLVTIPMMLPFYKKMTIPL